jgi:hypothetical protein
VSADGHAEATIGHQLSAARRDRPSGVYVQWHWNGHQLLVTNDRAGMGQLLYASLDSGNGIALSPHVDQLLQLGAPRELDDEALGCLLRLGFHLGVDTPFKSIRALPPNARLTWQPGRLQIDASPYRPDPVSVTREQAIDRYIELFRQSIDRRPTRPGSTVVPLTGGNDSRHIVLELCRRGTPPDLCVTVRRYPRVTCDDASVAENVACHLGIRHERLDLRSTIVQEDFRKYARTGPMSDEGGWASVMFDRIRTFGCAYDGIAGDVLGLERLGSRPYDDQLHSLVAHRQWRALATCIVNHYSVSDEALAPLLALASFRDCGRERVLQRIEAELESLADVPHPLAAWLLNSRTRREIAMMPWLLCSELNPFYAPYLDEDLVDFLSGLPAELFTCGGFHRAVIARGYPQWADVPYLVKSGNGGQPVSMFEAVQSIAELNAYAARRLPALLGLTCRWGLRRLFSRGGSHTAPRRVVQHLLVLEQLIRNGRYV